MTGPPNNMATFKDHKTKKKRKLENVGESDVSPKKQRTFNAFEFLKSLKKEDPVAALKTFMKLCKSGEENAAVEFLNSGCNPQELLSVLNVADNLPLIEPVFSAFTELVIGSLKFVPESRGNCEVAGRYLLQKHVNLIYNLLREKSNAKHRKVVLKLLTSLASLSISLAKYIINTLSFTPTTIHFLTYSLSSDYKECARTDFIHFLMAYFVDGNIELIKALLYKKELLISIFRGIRYDSVEIIELVLTMLRTKFLENSQVTKSQKLNVFNTSVVKQLLSLYRWLGPKNKRDTDYIEVDPEELQSVTQIVHSFMLVLCTSFKYGIAFQNNTLGTSGNRNKLIGAAFINLNSPWEVPYLGELLERVVCTCHDLLKPVLSSLQIYLVPRPSSLWIRAVDFIRRLFSNISIDHCFQCFHNFKYQQLIIALKNLTIPPLIMKMIDLNHEHPTVRHKSAVLLAERLASLDEFILKLKSLTLPPQEISLVIRTTKSYLLEYLPSSETIVSLWHKIETPELSEIPVPDENEQAYATLDLILTYRKFLACDLSLSPSHLFSIIKRFEGNTVPLRLKAVQLLFDLDAEIFSVDQVYFEEAINDLLSLLKNASGILKGETLVMLTKLLLNSGLFEGRKSELFLWFYCFDLIPENETKAVASAFVNVVKEVCLNVDFYINELEEIDVSHKNTINDTKHDELLDGFLESMEVDNSKKCYQHSRFLSCLLPASLKFAEDNCDECFIQYLSCVATYIMHAQTAPECIITLLEKFPVLSEKINKYALSWLNGTEQKNLRKIFPKDSLEYQLSCRSPDISRLSDPTWLREPSDLSEAIHLSLVFDMLLFQYSQLSKHKQLTEDEENVYISAMKTLIEQLSAFSKHSKKIAFEECEHLIESCLMSAFYHPVLINLFTPIFGKGCAPNIDTCKLFIELIELETVCSNTILQNVLLKPFKEKFLTSVQIAIQTFSKENKSEVSLRALRILEYISFSSTEIVQLLEKLVLLQGSAFANSMGLTPWGSLLTVLLKRLASKPNEVSVSTDFMKNVVIVMKYVEKFNHGIAALEEAFGGFSAKAQLPDVDVVDFFKTLLKKTDLSDSTINLAQVLLDSKSVILNEFLVKLIKGESTLLLDSSLLLHILLRLTNMWSRIGFYKKVYTRYKEAISKCVLEPCVPNRSITRCMPAVSYLMKTCMDQNECSALIPHLQTFVSKEFLMEKYHIQLIDIIFEVMMKFDGKCVEIFIPLIMELLLMQLQAAGEYAPDLCSLLLQHVDSSTEPKYWRFIRKNPLWSKFYKIVLKYGLKCDDLKQPQKNVLLLSLLTKFSNSLYKDKCKKEEILQFYEMVFSHSEFLNILLGQSELKYNLVELMLSLVKKHDKVAMHSHIPVLLGAYGASLSATDQLILELLQLYEDSGAVFHRYRPYLFGEAAVNHCGVKTDESLALWTQPHTSQVLDLFDIKLVTNTIINYPIHRSLSGANAESNKLIYDPAFYLPLFSHILAPESVVQHHKFYRGGAISLTLVSLCSCCSLVRAAAYSVLERFYTVIDSLQKGKDKLMWSQLIIALKNGIIKLGEANCRLPSVVAIFLARMSLSLSKPLDPLFPTLQEFLRNREAMDLTRIPHFFPLLQSTDLQYKYHRCWLLEILRDGLKLEEDLKPYHDCMVFKILMDLHSSSLIDRRSKELILEVLAHLMKLKKPMQRLVDFHGFLPWLHQTINQMKITGSHSVEILCEIVSLLWRESAQRDYLLLVGKHLLPLLSPHQLSALPVEVVNSCL